MGDHAETSGSGACLRTRSASATALHSEPYVHVDEMGSSDLSLSAAKRQLEALLGQANGHCREVEARLNADGETEVSDAARSDIEEDIVTAYEPALEAPNEEWGRGVLSSLSLRACQTTEECGPIASCLRPENLRSWQAFGQA